MPFPEMVEHGRGTERAQANGLGLGPCQDLENPEGSTTREIKRTAPSRASRVGWSSRPKE